MKRFIPTLAIALTALCAPAGAQAAFGITNFHSELIEANGAPATQAGSHPFALDTGFFVNYTGEGKSAFTDGRVKDAIFRQIAGLAGDVTAYPTCDTADFLTLVEGAYPDCPDDTAVGVVGTAVTEPGQWTGAGVFNLTPPPGVLIRLGFRAVLENVIVDIGVQPKAPYLPVARSLNISQIAYVYGVRFQLWGNPSDPEHDHYRGRCAGQSASLKPGEEFEFEPSEKACPVAPRGPFLTLPTRCSAPNPTSYAIDDYEDPGAFLSDGEPDLSDPSWLTGSVETEPFTGCDKLNLEPAISAQPTTRAAQSATGLDFSLDVSDPGLKNANKGATAQSDIRKTVVTLPPGMSVNPSQAEGLAVCSKADLERETLAAQPGEGCPQASKIGTAEVESPLVAEALKGSIYVAKPYENLAGNSLIAVYLVIKNPKLGLIVKQPLRVEPDPRTGQLVTTAEEIPQLPFSHFRLHFREGGRSPLISPPACGNYDGRAGDPEPVRAKLYPWAGGPPVEATSAFQITTGPNGGPCPQGTAPFHPGFEAGTANNAAGSYSPFSMRLTRRDGEQDMGRFSFVLPSGVVPKLTGIPYCPEAGIAQAKSRTGPHGGEEEIANPSCPAASQIGRTVAGAGVGGQLTFVPGSLYLAGPYHGDPISAVSITPAVAGPFDAGVVVVREALRLNPVTHVGEVDGAASDPIPHILKGIPLNVRELQVYADRPEFTLNATSCEEEQASSTIWGDGTALVPLGETPVTLASRYQAASCASLGFKPKLGLKLKGGTRRGKFPALHAVYTPRAGDANLRSLALAFPKSEFVEQGHFRTICTRVQFAAGQGFGSECPKGSIYGHVEAWSPLLAEPLSGPVYLRSSSHNLPDAIFALHGLVDIEVDVRIDSTHGRLRATVQNSPDAPVSRAVVSMQGGQKGLFVNSTNLCAAKHRADADVTGQNGRKASLHPLVQARCGEKPKRSKRHRR